MWLDILMEKVLNVCTLADSGFFKNFLYQGGVKSTVSWVFEDLKKFKISEGSDPNWCFPDSAQLAVSVFLCPCAQRVGNAPNFHISPR